ncbi:MAG: preprotein translocase subunit SecA [Rhodospirillaceae bacterium]|mgnify:FL=1|nr:preprotein translocase subunit SecA [Rhodospirillaceae bacterium]
MLQSIAQRIFGSANDREVKRLQGMVVEINALEPDVEKLTDDELRARTENFRQRYADGESLDDMLIEAFATVREGAKRTLGQRHYDVQMLGGMVLHQGKISEMRTGEGKTLVSTLPVYLNAITGKGVHVVTVNDYLATRDAGWMGAVFKFLGLTIGCITHGLDNAERQEAYACDITYGTNNEFGFDYLRDNMNFRIEEMVQREFHYAIVDEVDNIFIDEARTPLIISGPAEDAADTYAAIDKVIPRLTEADFEKDEKQRTVVLTEPGTERVEEILGEMDMLGGQTLYDITNVSLVHHVQQALRAHTLFQKDTDYIVKDDHIIIIDEFTGRMMEGRRFSEGLHQALEAKEGVTVQNENQTLASITFQNYFRLYPKLAGMTGTAMTEAGEFAEIYSLEVVEIPTNLDQVRIDQDDEVYRTADEKYNAIMGEIREAQKKDQPVLVGTVSIEKSELLSEILKKNNIDHHVLNARFHEQEAFIIAQAGQPRAVTIATNMAGRGTDIQLGGNVDMQIDQQLAKVPEAHREEKRAELTEKIQAEASAAKKIVMEAGGLYVIGTERHEARRIDNQLRGRAGRQGDPGRSKFYLSLEDDLMRIFGSERIDTMLRKLGLEEGEAIIHPWINKALEKAQKKVEERNYEIRKNLLKFDDVMNDQRKVIYEQRKELMVTEDVSETVVEMREQVIEDMVARCIPEKAYAEQWDADTLKEDVLRVLAIDLPIKEWAGEEGIADEEICERLIKESANKMAAKTANYGAELMRMAEKSLLLQLLDQSWKEHLLALDHLRQGIGLRAYGQKDPLNEYKREAFDMFEEMLNNLRETVTSVMCHLELSLDADELAAMEEAEYTGQEMHETRTDPAFAVSNASGQDMHPAAVMQPQPAGSNVLSAATDPEDVPAGWVLDKGLGRWINPENPETWGKVPRNATCPCGSGKKFKHCHGKV